MAEKKLITIITPCFNSGETIRKTISSVLSQSYSELQYIIVDDCSTDNSRNIVDEFLEDKRIIFIKNEKNLGVAASRNKGLGAANGDYVCFLDSDDWWSKDKIDCQLKFMESNNIGLSYMDYVRVDINGAEVRRVLPKNKASFNDILAGNYIGNLTAMVRREWINNFRFEKIGHEDYVFWLNILSIDKRIARKVKTSEVMCYYRVANNSLSSNKIKALKWQWNIYRSLLGMSFKKSIFYFFLYIFNAIKKRV